MSDGEVPAYAPFAALGAVLDIARVDMPPGGPAQAAVQAMRLFSRRYDARLAALNPGRNLDDLFHITIDTDVESQERNLVGRDIDAAAFLGPGYDIDSDQLQLFRYREGSRAGIVSGGLAYALLDPPYGLRRPSGKRWGPFGSPRYAREEPRWMRGILRDFCASVLDLPDPRDATHLRICEWPTDWSTYFAEGQEWWGTFFWTVEHIERTEVTVIGASSSD